MSMNSFIRQFTSKGPIEPSLSIVILTDGIYLCKLDEQEPATQTTFHQLEGDNWEAVLNSALKDEACQGLNAIVTLGSQSYQSYHIEKPTIPREEWPAALPFLLKDMVSMRVTDIVADGVEITQSSKVQAYVLTNKLVMELKQVLDSHNVRLLTILPEDEVWSHIRPDSSAYMLLHRSKNSEFKIGIFVEQGSVFQRTVRGLQQSVTGEFSSSLELDSLALELQRSMDYLSSQLKQVQVNRLFLCCDDEDAQKLQQELQERLNVTVEPLFIETPLSETEPVNDVADEGVDSKAVVGLVSEDQAIENKPLDLSQESVGGVLAISALKNVTKSEINLYPEHLKPKKELFCLGTVVASWLVIVVVMLAAYGFYSFENQQLDTQISKLKADVNQLTTKTTSLQKQLDDHHPSASKLAAVARLKEDVETKKESLKVISRFDSKQMAGYSGIMQGLSSIGRHDISLTRIQIDNGRMDVQGLAKSPEVVPNWVQHFKTQLNLIGRTFESLSIGRNENDVVVFSLRSSRGDK